MARRALAGIALALGAACGGAPAPAGEDPLPLAAGECAPCHAEIVAQWAATAHAATSAKATPETVRGPFAPGRHVLQTRVPSLRFEMRRDGERMTQTARDTVTGQRRTEPMELVIGSGRVGQSYLYWRDGLLFQLPVSWLAGADRWINSPGYEDGTVDFDRLIVPRCLECHATRFTIDSSGPSERYGSAYQLGVSCGACHGDGREHLAWARANPGDSAASGVVNPGRLGRERQLDNCALCHGGMRNPKRPSGTYRVGEPLDDWYHPAEVSPDLRPDVHGNQVELLRQSACFRASPAMTCATCHDVHQRERDVERLAERCVTCHAGISHPAGTVAEGRLMAGCIDCHMPREETRMLWVNTPTGRFAPKFRTHRVAVYPAR